MDSKGSSKTSKPKTRSLTSQLLDNLDSLEQQRNEAEAKLELHSRVVEENERMKEEMLDLKVESNLLKARVSDLSKSEKSLALRLQSKHSLNLKLEENIQVKEFLNTKITEANQEYKASYASIQDKINYQKLMLLEHDLEK